MAKADLPTLKQIYDAHSWKRDYEKLMPFSRFFYRPIGFLVTWGAIRIGITTEMTTYLSGMIGIFACLLLISSSQTYLILGIILLHLFNLLDCVDGSIARVMKTESPYGKFLDSVLGDLIDFAFFFIVSIMAFRHPELLKWPDPLNQGAVLWLIIGCLCAFFYIFLRHVEMLFEIQIYKEQEKLFVTNSCIDQKGNKFDTSKVSEIKKVKAQDILRIIDRNIRVRETIYVLLLAAFLLQLVDIFLLIYFIYFLFRAFISCAVYFIRAKNLRDMQFKTKGPS